MTKKPHEETWEHDGKAAVWRKGSAADLVHVPPDGHSMKPEQARSRAAIIAAAPAMAQALLMLASTRKDGGKCWCQPMAVLQHSAACEEANEVLLQAGVLP